MSRSSDDESDEVMEGEEEEKEAEPAIKFRVVASGRMRSCVRVQNSDVAVGPPDAAQNDANSPSWVGDMPLPRVVAEKVTGAPIDHAEWEAVATAAFANRNGGFLKGFTRRTNALLNSDEDEGAKFQWDVKLTRNIAPSSDPKNSNMTIMKYKTAKKCLDVLWAMLRDRGGDVAADVADTVETDWFLLKPRDLAAWLGKHIMQEPTQSVRQLRSCRSHSPVRRRRSPPAPGAAPAPVAQPQVPLGNVKPQLATLMRKSKVVGDMLFSDAVLRSLAEAGRPLPTSGSWWAPRWLRFPIVRGRYQPIQNAAGQPVGEQFIIQLFNSAQSANAVFGNNSAQVSPAVFGLPVGLGVAPGVGAVEEPGAAGVGVGAVEEPGAAGLGAVEEPGAAGLGAVEEPDASFYDGGGGDGPDMSPDVDMWTYRVNAAVGAFNQTASPFTIQAEGFWEGREFPLTQEEFQQVCEGPRSSGLSAKRLTYAQAKEVWEDRTTFVLQKRDITLLKFYTRDAVQRLIGYVMLAPLDLDICTVALVCSSTVLSEWNSSQLRQMFKKFKPKVNVPAGDDAVKLELMLFFLAQLGVVVPADMRTMEQVAQQLDDAVQNALLQYKSLYRFVFMAETRDSKPLPPAHAEFVNGFNQMLPQETNAIMEIHAACGTRVGDVRVGQEMMQAVVRVCSSLGCRFVCMNMDTNAPVNHALLKALGYKQGIMNGYVTNIRDGNFVSQFLRASQHRLGMYAFTFVPAKKGGE